MPKPLYKYNEETCQYERIRVKPFDVVFYLSGVVVLGMVILAGLLVAHDYIIDSEKEISLRNENHALQKNHVILTSQLYTIENTLEELASEDKNLHQKFFGTPLENPSRPKSSLDKKQLLLGDASTFRESIEKVRTLTLSLLKESSLTNRYTSNSLGNTLKKLKVMPSLKPVASMNAENIVSGFGMRVNPFHKGIYEHPGIDISTPRGTDVLATANGVVIEAKRNSVQAGYGNYIELDHGDGFITRYAHLDEIRVKAGQKLLKGATIGTSGSSGGSVSPHLHYEIIRNGINVDPAPYMMEGLSSREFEMVLAQSKKENQSLD